MKIRLYTIDFEISRQVKRVALLLAVPVVVVASLGAVVSAAPKNTFSAGTPISASAVNQNFADLDSRIGGQLAMTAVKSFPGKSTLATFINIAQITYTAPSAGTAYVTANGVCVVGAGLAADLGLSANADPTAGPPFGVAIQNVGGVTATMNFTSQGSFPVTAGPQTLYFQGRNNGGSCTVSLHVLHAGSVLTSN